MLFNSLLYALFLPFVFLLYWFVFNKSLKWQNIFLLIVSYYFYSCWDWRFVFLLALSKMHLTVLEDYIYALKYIIADTKNRGIKFFLFEATLPENFYESFDNNAEIDKLLESLGKYHNFNQEQKFMEQNSFMDDSHINQKGVSV